jgi:hypothetical protein
LIAIAVVGTVIATRFSGPKLDGLGMASYMPERDAAVLSWTWRRSAIPASSKNWSARLSVKNRIQDLSRPERLRLQKGSGPRNGELAQDTHYILAEGRFDWDKLKKYATNQGGSCDGDFCSLKGSTPGRIISFYPISKKYMALASSRMRRRLGRSTPALR